MATKNGRTPAQRLTARLRSKMTAWLLRVLGHRVTEHLVTILAAEVILMVFNKALLASITALFGA